MADITEYCTLILYSGKFGCDSVWQKWMDPEFGEWIDPSKGDLL